MLLRLVKGRKHRDFSATHIEVTYRQDGIEFEVCPGSRRFRLPDDGSIVYQMNDRGDNQQVYRWPLPKPKDGPLADAAAARVAP